MTNKEALDIVNEALEQPDNSVIFKHTGLNELKKALEQAQKQEKLLELYRKLSVIRNDLLSYCEVVDYDYDDLEYIVIDLEKKIKELENDK